MSKPLAGKRAFEAMGRRSTDLGMPRTSEHYRWPKWAQQAFMRGRMLQHTWRRNRARNNLD